MKYGSWTAPLVSGTEGTGVWYPTTVKTTGTIWVKQVNPMIVEPRDQHWRLSVEFKESLPDGLFDIKAAMTR